MLEDQMSYWLIAGWIHTVVSVNVSKQSMSISYPSFSKQRNKTICKANEIQFQSIHDTVLYRVNKDQAINSATAACEAELVTALEC